jgi:hypothetical protein
MARLARGRTLGGIAAELGLQFHEVGEDVGLAPQFVGDHRWLARNRRDHGDADAAALHGLDQRAEIAVTGEQHDLIDMLAPCGAWNDISIGSALSVFEGLSGLRHKNKIIWQRNRQPPPNRSGCQWLIFFQILITKICTPSDQGIPRTSRSQKSARRISKLCLSYLRTDTTRRHSVSQMQTGGGESMRVPQGRASSDV